MSKTQTAIDDLLEVWDEYTVMDLGPHMTCSEANALAEFFRAVGQESMADALIEGHATGDDEGDDHYEQEEDE